MTPTDNETTRPDQARLDVHKLMAIAAAENEADLAEHGRYQRTLVDQAELIFTSFRIGVWALSRDDHAEATRWFRRVVEAGIEEARPLLQICSEALASTPRQRDHAAEEVEEVFGPADTAALRGSSTEDQRLAETPIFAAVVAGQSDDTDAGRPKSMVKVTDHQEDDLQVHSAQLPPPHDRVERLVPGAPASALLRLQVPHDESFVVNLRPLAKQLRRCGRGWSVIPSGSWKQSIWIRPLVPDIPLHTAGGPELLVPGPGDCVDIPQVDPACGSGAALSAVFRLLQGWIRSGATHDPSPCPPTPPDLYYQLRAVMVVFSVKNTYQQPVEPQRSALQDLCQAIMVSRCQQRDDLLAAGPWQVHHPARPDLISVVDLRFCPSAITSTGEGD